MRDMYRSVLELILNETSDFFEITEECEQQRPNHCSVGLLITFQSWVSPASTYMSQPAGLQTLFTASAGQPDIITTAEHLHVLRDNVENGNG